MKSYISTNRENKAKKVIEYNNINYSQEIEYSINNTNVYNNELFNTYKLKSDDEIIIPNIVVEKLKTDEAVWKYGNDCCILNFASYKYPGGGFIIGAIAQEEALCHVSTLYNVISDNKFKHYYEYNRLHLNKSLYSNFAIYSPNIIFYNDTVENTVNVITCPAPNFKAYSENNNGLMDEQYKKVLKSRIKYILDIAEKEKQTTLILGAFGCGVFKNDPYIVADIFKTLLKTGIYSFKKVIFAIPDDTNFIPFNNTFNTL